MFHRYDYEAEYYPSLSRLPLDLRRKLDVAGIKISLKDWLAISLDERMALCHLPCDSDEERQVFTRYLNLLTEKYCGKPSEMTEPVNADLWSDTAVSAPVVQKSSALGAMITPNEWRRWQSHHRYALYKTAVSKSQPEAFEQVLNQLRGKNKKA